METNLGELKGGREGGKSSFPAHNGLSVKRTSLSNQLAGASILFKIPTHTMLVHVTALCTVVHISISTVLAI